ncbi:CDKN3, partial [Symbiodinium pilosum]
VHMAGLSPSGGGYHVKLCELLGPEPDATCMPAEKVSLLPTFLSTEWPAGSADEHPIPQGVLRENPVAERVLRPNPVAEGVLREPSTAPLMRQAAHTLPPGVAQHGAAAQPLFPPAPPAQ